MTAIHDSVAALKQFNVSREKHLYLEVVDDGIQKRLRTVEKSWICRIIMWLGWSNASMSKVVKYIEENIDLLCQNVFTKPSLLLHKMMGKIRRYDQRHPNTIAQQVHKIQSGIAKWSLTPTNLTPNTLAATIPHQISGPIAPPRLAIAESSMTEITPASHFTQRPPPIDTSPMALLRRGIAPPPIYAPTKKNPNPSPQHKAHTPLLHHARILIPSPMMSQVQLDGFPSNTARPSSLQVPTSCSQPAQGSLATIARQSTEHVEKMHQEMVEAVDVDTAAAFLALPERDFTETEEENVVEILQRSPIKTFRQIVSGMSPEQRTRFGPVISEQMKKLKQSGFRA